MVKPQLRRPWPLKRELVILTDPKRRGHPCHGGPREEALPLVRRQREQGKMGARAFTVISTGK